MSAPIAVTIAGSDSGGGAGIQADLKTFSALGVYGASVITAVTAQNTRGVDAVLPLPADFVTAQIDSVYRDLDVAATKIGMLGDGAIIAAVGAGLARHRVRNIVLDPVLVATSGDPLLRADDLGALRGLFKHARVGTPNLPEAAALLGEPAAADETAMRRQADALLKLGAEAILLKGGHGSGAESVDLLVTAAGGFTRFAAPRIETRHTHGTGCTLASAIAAGLAKGQSLETAIGDAKTYVSAAIAAADRLAVGQGRGPVHHFWKWW
jgi:hydroxymethylpyrimidine/phosphomethylpyrimidine kinase